MNGKTLTQSSFYQTTEIGSNWIAVRVNLTLIDKFKLLPFLPSNWKQKILENQLQKQRRANNKTQSLREHLSCLESELRQSEESIRGEGDASS